MLAIWGYLHSYVFNRAAKVITKVSVDDTKILLDYYTLWFKSTTLIERGTYRKAIVNQRKHRYTLYIYDHRFVSPQCMKITFSKSIFDPSCENKEDIESVIKLLVKYNYNVIYDNSYIF